MKPVRLKTLMEGTPSTPPPKTETDSFDKEEKTDSKDKTTKAKGIGEILFKPKEESSKKSADKDDVLGETLFKTSESSDETDKPAPSDAQEQLFEYESLLPENVPEVSEADAPLEHLSEEERRVVAREIVNATEAAEASGIDETAEEAKDVQRFRERVRNLEDIEVAYEETAAEAEASEDEAAPESIHDFSDDDVEVPLHEAVPAAETIEDTAADSDAEDPAATTNPSGATGPAGAAAGGGGGRRGGGRTTAAGSSPPPPRGPHPLAPTATQVGARGAGYYRLNALAAGGRPGAGFLPEYMPVRDELILKNLPGAIVGYLIGRRRGRIKAERKAKTVRKKLEEQVDSLQQQIGQKEQLLREAARSRVREQQQANSRQTERKPVVAKPERLDSSLNRRVAAEANQLHGKKHPGEHIGKVLVGVEAAASAAPDARTERPTEKASIKQEQAVKRTETKTGKQAETMNRSELMMLSERITVDGTSLRQIYESRLVGERGLRRLVQEHLRGGDVKKALRREITEREIDFERDPAMRDHPTSSQIAGGGSAGSTPLNKLLQKVEGEHSDDEEVAFMRARAAYEESQQERRQQQRKVIDVAMVTAIVVLTLAVALLIFRQ